MLRKIDSSVSVHIKAQQYIHNTYIIVKELIENSLDANSTTIKIILRNNSIIVEDNGKGIEDLSDICKSGYTSKENNSYKVLGLNYGNTDFYHGFRGQALASIAEQSDIEIISRNDASETAKSIKIESGIRGEIKSCAGNVGTTIKITNVFKNCPIRQKSDSKTLRSSISKIIELLKGFIYVYDVNFTLINNEKPIFIEQGSANTVEFSIKKHGTNLFNMKNDKFELLIFPSDKSKSQFMFLDKRLCKCAGISNTIEKCFLTFFDHSPTYILIFFCEADVNLSIDKSEIILKDNKNIESLIKNGVIEYFSSNKTIQEYTSAYDDAEDSKSDTKRESVHNKQHAFDSIFSSQNCNNIDCSEKDEPSSYLSSQHINSEGVHKSSSLDFLLGLNIKKPKIEAKDPNSKDILVEQNKDFDDLKMANVNKQSIFKPDFIYSNNIEICNLDSENKVGKSFVDTSVTVVKENLREDCEDSIIEHQLVEKYCSNVTDVDITDSPMNENVKRINNGQRLAYKHINEISLGHSSIIIEKSDFKKMNIIGQFNQGFILCSLEKNGKLFLIVVDQHAADEIYNFERLKKSFILKKQNLIKPISLNVSEIDQMTIDDNLEIFLKNGFEIKNGQLLTIPVYHNVFFNEKDVHSLLDNIVKGEYFTDKFRVIMASKACRTSIMIGCTLGNKDMRVILDNLSHLDCPWNCPHGRPTFKIISEL